MVDFLTSKPGFKQIKEACITLIFIIIIIIVIITVSGSDTCENCKQKNVIVRFQFKWRQNNQKL